MKTLSEDIITQECHDVLKNSDVYDSSHPLFMACHDLLQGPAAAAMNDDGIGYIGMIIITILAFAGAYTFLRKMLAERKADGSLPCVSCGHPSDTSTADDADMCYPCMVQFLCNELHNLEYGIEERVILPKDPTREMHAAWMCEQREWAGRYKAMIEAHIVTLPAE